ncbi:ubiquinol-cytochrome C reductase [Azospirillum thiophilum]|uniref:Ubiquinol-cytochrome c reductase iron-sulfur subunit n=1 Tax=Azospirillum thiophilum TaxID=528244 RepID=A0AAC9EXU9_9PROT|nr:ubiquinol-cytochrome c reductase iron-sulfur subunit [Azospirillum thiophilum]ALG72386.1 ubiquinol-cytochrome C reductase [Azospirillum thiophilum]KJR61350.1 ubiquinol-cytochrome C reductase [Azospirillum thiophilum]
MAQTTHPSGTGGHAASGGEGGSRRDFLYLATGAVGVVGAASAAWPFIDSLNPAADTLALASIDVDLAPVAVGQAITVTWRGKPVFVRHRTAEEIESAKTVNLGDLRDPAADDARVKKPEWLIVIGICTHLGCVPLGQKVTDPRGEYGGWFCPCHGSHYDTAGRIRKGPAPANLVLPTYAFTGDTKIRLG